MCPAAACLCKDTLEEESAREARMILMLTLDNNCSNISHDCNADARLLQRHHICVSLPQAREGPVFWVPKACQKFSTKSKTAVCGTSEKPDNMKGPQRLTIFHQMEQFSEVSAIVTPHTLSTVNITHSFP